MHHMSFVRLSQVITVIGAVAVAGCGGGGGGTTTDTFTPFTAMATGVAAKGIIKNATVTAIEVNAAGNEVRPVGTADTDASGRYQLTIGSSYTLGPIKLVLSAKNDDSTTMVCDVSTGCGAGIGFGQDYALSSTFKLESYLAPVSSGATVRAQITPYTNMAAARIEAQVQAGSTLDASLVAAAISEVSQIVGVDVSDIEPVDITDPEAIAAAGAEALQYAAFNSGIGNLAFAGGDLDAGIDAVADAFADGVFDGSDEISITEIVAAVADETDYLTTLVTDTATTSILFNTVASLELETASGTYDPEPSDAATLAAVSQAKALVSQTRTWGTELAALKTPADAFGVDIETAKAVLNSNSGALAGIFRDVLTGALTAVEIEAASPDGLLAQDYAYTITYPTETGTAAGTAIVSVLNDNGTLKLTIAADDIAGVSVSGEALTNIPSTILGTSSPEFSLVDGQVMNVTGIASMSTPSGDASISITNAAVAIALKPDVATTTTTATANDFASIAFNGGLIMQANGVTFDGTGSLNFIANNVQTPVSPLSLAEIAVSGLFSSSKGQFTAAASVKFNNAATFDTIGLLTYEPVIWVDYSEPGDALGLGAAYTAIYGEAPMWVGYHQNTNQSYAQGESFQYIFSEGDLFGATAAVESAIKARYANPAPVSITDIYASYDESYGFGTWYTARLAFPDFESAGNFADATVTLSSSLTLAGFPEANLTITGNRTAYTAYSDVQPVKGNAVATLSFEGQRLTFDFDTTTDPETQTLTIANPDGVKLELNAPGGAGSDVVGVLRVDGVQVGTVDSSSGLTLIRYDDGTFESLI